MVLWSLSGMPWSIFHLVTLVTYLGHFAKRVLEALFLHKYSKKMCVVPAIEVMAVVLLGFDVMRLLLCEKIPRNLSFSETISGPYP